MTPMLKSQLRLAKMSGLCAGGLEEKEWGRRWPKKLRRDGGTGGWREDDKDSLRLYLKRIYMRENGVTLSDFESLRVCGGVDVDPRYFVRFPLFLMWMDRGAEQIARTVARENGGNNHGLKKSWVFLHCSVHISPILRCFS